MTDFQILTQGFGVADLETGEVSTDGVAIIDLDEMASHITPTILDPTIPMVETDDPSRPATATPTNGPHRYTVVVPNKGGNGENSIFSVGQAGPADRIQDTGITAMTKTHIHWHTVDAPQTMVLLGGPTAHHGWEGPNGVDNPGTNNGYMVVTEGLAWQESRGHQYLMSKDADATLRSAGPSKRVVIQADQGEIDILAQKKVYGVAPTITLMAPAAFAPETTVNYGGAWQPTLPQTQGGSMSKTATTIAGILTGAHDLGMKFPKIVKSWKKGKKELETSTTDTAKWALDLAKWAMTVNKVLKLYTPEPSPGQLKLGAEADIGALAGGDISMWGGTGFSAGGGVWTSVSAGISASVKAVGWAGLGGMWTSVKGYRKLDLGAEYGKTTVKGKTAVDVTCEDGEAKVGGKTAAQVVSEGTTFVIGKDRTVVTSGEGDGSGMVSTPGMLKLGIVSNAKDAAGADTVPNRIVFEKDKRLELTYKGHGVLLNDSGVAIGGKEVEIVAQSAAVTVKGSRILLG